MQVKRILNATIISILIYLSFLSLISCNKINDPNNEKIEINTQNLILGYWTNSITDDGNTFIFQRTSEFKNDYGLYFGENFNYIERNNVGGCGTPPITYGDFKGDFDLLDSNIIINVDFWGGEAKINWKLISVNDSLLTLERVSQDYKYRE